MPVTQSKVTLDVTQFTAAAQQVAQGLQSQVDAALKLAVAYEKFNKDGKKIEVVLQALDKQGKLFTATLKLIDSALTITNVKVKQTDVLLKQLEERYAQMSRAAQANAKVQQRVADEIAKAQAKAAQSAVDAIERQLAAQRQAARNVSAAGIEGRLRGAVTPGGTASAINAQEAGIQRILTLIRSGAVSAREFETILSRLQKGGFQGLSGLSPDQSRLAAALRSLRDIGTATDDVAAKTRSWHIPLSGISRLLEASVIHRFFGSFLTQLTNSIPAAAKFSISIAEIQTISQKAQLTTQQWTQGINRLAGQFGRTQADVAEAAYQALSNQVVKGAQTFQFLEDTLKFANATVSTATDAGNLLAAAINAYGFSAADATRISSVFFKTIELGRVRASEMANTFGRTAQLASAVGVSFEEVNAAIATFTIQGTKFSDATVLLNNIILKLLKPTTGMNALLAEWGVLTGKDAIATFGFAGVLNKMILAIQEGKGDLAELGGELRAIRGLAGLASNGINIFNANLKQIRSGTAEFQKATRIVEESTGKRFERQLEKTKIAFVEGFGAPAVNNIVRVAESLEKFGITMEGVLSVAGKLIATFIVFKTAQTGAFVTQAIVGFIQALRTVNVQMTIAEARLAKFTGQAAAAKAATGGATGADVFSTAFSLSFLAGTFLFGETDRDARRATESHERFLADRKAALDKAYATTRDAEKRSQIELQQSRQDALDTTFRGILQSSTNEVKLSAEKRRALAADYKIIAEEAENAGQAFTDSVKNSVSEAKKAITDAQAAIKASQKFSLDLPRRATGQIFEGKLGFATDLQAIELIKNRVRDLERERRSLTESGSNFDLAEARKLNDEILKLKTNLFNKEQGVRKTQFEADARRGLIRPELDPITGERRLVFTAETLKLEREIRKEQEEAQRVELAFQEQQRALIEQKKLEAADETKRLRDIIDIQKDIAKLELRDETGKIKPEFAIDPRRASDKLQVLQAKLLEKATPAEIVQFDLIAKQATQVAALRKELEAEVANTAIEEQRRVFQQQKIDIERIRSEILKNKELSEGVSATKLSEVRSELTGAAATAAKGAPGLVDKFLLGADITGRGLERLRSIQAAQKDLAAGFVDVQRAITEFDRTGDQALALQIQERILRLGQITAQLEAVSQGKDVALVRQPGDTVTVLDKFKGIAESIRAAAAEQGKISALSAESAQLERFVAGVNVQVAQLPELLAAAGRAGIPTTEALKNNFAFIAQTLPSINRSLDSIIGKLGRAPSSLPLDIPGQRVGGRMSRYFADGGFVSFVPRGRDKIPAMLEDGEFVVNSKQSRRFFSQLTQMNAGITPSYFAEGGPVSQTIGDINITVQGGDTSEQSIRSIARGLRRELRRGTVSLS